MFVNKIPYEVACLTKGKKRLKTKKKSKTTKKKPKKEEKPVTISDKETIPEINFETLDELLDSSLTRKDKLFYIVDLSNLSYKVDESKESLAEKLLYESTIGLDEMANILWDVYELRDICVGLGLDTTNKNKNNLIGMLIVHLPCKKKRKIKTIIEEAVEDDLERLRIYNIFVMYPDGRNLFSYNLEAIPVGDSSMITSALNAITHLIKEITKGVQLDSIDVTDKELIFEYGKVNLAPEDPERIGWNLIGVALINKESKVAKRLLEDFLGKFEKEYVSCLLPRFDGCLDYFKSAIDIVFEVFSEYIHF